jgi:cytochrome c-type protein NapC
VNPPEENKKGFFGRLASPSARWSVAALLGTGILVGVLGTVGFEAGLKATSTEAFCTSCHEMYDNSYAMLESTSHFHNKTGVRPTCADCHVPQEFVPKMIRKIEAAREVWGHFTGIIDTPEKYAAHAPVMKAREIARLQANDSAECRNCHEMSQTILELQTEKAQKYHQALEHKDKTCIDCHRGIAHTPEGEAPAPYPPLKG